MNKTQQPSDRDFTDATDADALFDDEATVLAQPVVPLAANASDAPEEMTVVAGTPGAPASGLLTAARRPTMLALVLVSALVGVFIGGAGLYLFQRSRTAPAPHAASPAQQSAEAATTTTTTTAPVEHQQPAAQNSEPPPPAPQDSQPAPAAQTRPASVREQQQPEAEHRREGEEDDDRADSQRRDRRRGRGRDDEEERDATLEQASERRRRRDGAIDTQAPIPDDASPASRRAARVEEALRRIENNRAARRARRVGVLN